MAKVHWEVPVTAQVKVQVRDRGEPSFLEETFDTLVELDLLAATPVKSPGVGREPYGGSEVE